MAQKWRDLLRKPNNHSSVIIVAVVFLISNPLISVGWNNFSRDSESDITIFEPREEYNEDFMEKEPSVDNPNSIEPAMEPQSFMASYSNGNFQYPANSTIIPMAHTQTEAQLRNAYKSLFKRIYDYDDVELIMKSFNYNSFNHPPGTFVSMNDFGGNYNHTITNTTFNITAALSLHPAKIAVFKSELKDDYGQNLTWEEGYFERIFRVYLWGDYFDTINESAIKEGGLQDYDIFIIPAVTKGYENSVLKKLGSGGKAKLRQFVRAGHLLYAQGGSCFIAEAAELVPDETVLLDKRIEAKNNYADMTIVNKSSIMSQSWLCNQMYLLDDPVLNATNQSAVVAKYSGNLTNSSLINTSAIMLFDYYNGQVVLTNGHPSVNYLFYPIVFNALLLGMSMPPDIRATARQLYNSDVPSDLIPAQEPNVTVEVELTYLNFWPEPSGKKINLTETISSA
ncbi:MAG: hypothetical protein JSV49_05800, partial [Thermoplasmata archaeon]